MKILVISGGNSSEREISFRSAENIKKALLQNNHDVYIFDLKNNYKSLENSVKNIDIIFPVLHGEEGEGGKLHKFLSKLNKPIVGTKNYIGMNEAWNKILFKKYCDKNKILTPKWTPIKKAQDIKNFGFPCVLKSDNGGSSREVVILESQKDLLNQKTNKLLSSHLNLYVEQYISGIEITVGIFNDNPLPVIEIIPPKNGWFDYENKYSGTTQEIPFAPSVSKSLQEKAQKTALKIHRDFDLGTYSRTDFIIHRNKIFTLEINTIPGLTPESLLPKAAIASGIEFNIFVEQLIKLAK